MPAKRKLEFDAPNETNGEENNKKDQKSEIKPQDYPQQFKSLFDSMDDFMKDNSSLQFQNESQLLSVFNQAAKNSLETQKLLSNIIDKLISMVDLDNENNDLDVIKLLHGYQSQSNYFLDEFGKLDDKLKKIAEFLSKIRKDNVDISQDVIKRTGRGIDFIVETKDQIKSIKKTIEVFEYYVNGIINAIDNSDELDNIKMKLTDFNDISKIAKSDDLLMNALMSNFRNMVDHQIGEISNHISCKV